MAGDLHFGLQYHAFPRCLPHGWQWRAALRLEVRLDIFVRNLSREVGEDDLRKVFEPYGSVTSITLVEDKETGRQMGFGFVKMSSKDEAVSAINALKGITLKGRSLEFQDSRTRFERRQLSDRRNEMRETPERRSSDRRSHD